MADKLIIFDTTLRDGEQSPGASMTREEKLRIARQLERMRVDVIEAGFAAASDGDFESVQAIAQAVRESTVCSLARANENDIHRAGEAIAAAARGRIHTFIATSSIHMEKKLRMQPDQVVEQAIKAIPQGTERVNVDQETLSKPLQEESLYAPCKAGSTHFKFKIAVWRGKAVAIDMTTTPKNPKLAECLKTQIRAITWPAKVPSLNTVEYAM